jgi:23S rRNA pseudouridine2605 synthase
VRLARYLAHAGVASRRSAEQLIAAGRVRVGGQVVTDPALDVDEDSGVEVNRRPIQPEPTEVWAVNKPAGVVSTARETGRRRAVTELVDSEKRLYPVGRLDADSTGLLLLTNDGELANRLTHPRYGVPKTYRVRVARPPASRDLERLRRGIRLQDGRTAPAEVARTDEREIEITIREGRKRQIRRMVGAIENEVEELARIRIGALELGGLRRGEARRLSQGEVAALWKDSAP